MEALVALTMFGGAALVIGGVFYAARRLMPARGPVEVHEREEVEGDDADVVGGNAPSDIRSPMRTADLRGIESVRLRVKGTGYWVDVDQRHRVGGTDYLLVREPSNPHDRNAVAVHDADGRKVGYVSAARAAILAPVLDTIDAEAFVVSGAGPSEDSVRLWVDLPKADALRRYARGL
ncbi:HIRAN domain-containing protein [Microbacterium gilvum]